MSGEITGKVYLGDGVYVVIENGMVKLTAENGVQATDTIYLEPEVFTLLKEFVSNASGGKL
jgi:hypothetical protein